MIIVSMRAALVGVNDEDAVLLYVSALQLPGDARGKSGWLTSRCRHLLLGRSLAGRGQSLPMACE